MPIKKMRDLMSKIVGDKDQRVDDIMLMISRSETHKDMKDVVINLFSIIDTNHKKNQQVMVDILDILFILGEDKVYRDINGNGQYKASKPVEKTKPSTPKKGFWSSLETIHKSMIIGGVFVMSALVLIYSMYVINPSAADHAEKAVISLKKSLKDK